MYKEKNNHYLSQTVVVKIMKKNEKFIKYKKTLFDFILTILHRFNGILN